MLFAYRAEQRGYMSRELDCHSLGKLLVSLLPWCLVSVKMAVAASQAAPESNLPNTGTDRSTRGINVPVRPARILTNCRAGVAE